MLPSRLKTRPNGLLKLSAMSLVVATLSGCGEDAKDCGGFWDKTFGREACSKSIVNNGGTQLPVNTVTVELSAKATTGKKLEIVSSIDGSVANASNQAIVTSKSRDTLLAMVDDKIYLKALKYNDTPVKLTPASTAIYLVLQLKGMIQLPDNQLPKAIAAIESHTGYKDLVSYIDFKVNTGYADPINVELDYALMSLVMAIAKDIKPEDYLNTVAVWSPVKQYVAKQTTSLDVGDVLLMIVGIQPTYAGDEATTLGNSELKVGQPNPSVKFTNYTFNPYFAYVDDGVTSGKWNYIAGKDSIFSFSFDLSKTSAAVSIKNTDTGKEQAWKYLRAFYQAAKGSVQTGNQEASMTLAGVTAAGSHKINVESMGICQVLPGLGVPFNQATAQQTASSLMNAFTIMLTLAEVIAGDQELANAQKEFAAELTKPDVLAQLTQELAKINEAIDKAKATKEQVKASVKTAKILNKFLKTFVSEAIKIQEKKSEKDKGIINNDLLLLRGLLGATDEFLSVAKSFIDVNEATTEEEKSFLVSLSKELGKDLVKESVDSFAKALAIYIFDAYDSEKSKNNNEKLLSFVTKVARTSDIFSAFKPESTAVSQPLALMDAVLHNAFIQTLMSKGFEKLSKTAVNALVSKGVLESAKQANVLAKAAALTWSVGTKALPMLWDSCTVSNKLSIAVINGKVSNYTEPKADFWIEDATGKVVYWFNDTSGKEQKSGTTVALIPNKQYTFHVKSKQEGILDYSRTGSTDAVHQTDLLGFRAPVKVYGISLAQQTDQKLTPMLNVQLCARRSSRDFNVRSIYGLANFAEGTPSFTCLQGAGELTTESLPFISANSSVYAGVTYNNLVFRESLADGLTGTAWSELYEKYKDYGFGGQAYYKKTFVATESLKSFTLNIDGFNSEYSRTFKIDVVNGSEAPIEQLTNNSQLTINDKVKFALGTVVGSVKNVRWTLVDSTGKVISGPTTQLPTASEEFVMSAAGKYTVEAELLDDKGQVTGKSTVELDVKSPVYESISVNKIPVGQPVTITVTGNLPPTAAFTLEGATCGEPLFKNNVPFIGDTLTEVCTVSSAKDNIPLTVKQKAADESGIVFTLAAVDTLTVSGRFVLDAKNGSKDIFGDHHLYFSPPVDQIKDVDSTTGDILGYSRSRKDMECTFKPTSNAKVGASPDKPLTDANGYATNISPFLNGFAHMALITGGNQLIGIDGATFAIPARQTLWLKVNDDVFEDNVGHFNIDYTCWESALAIQPLATEPIVGTQAIFSLSNLIIDGVKSVVWKVGEAVVSIFDGINNVFGHIFDAVGDFVVSATLKDANDNEITTASTTINVKPLVCPEGQIEQGGKCVDSTPAIFEDNFNDNINGVTAGNWTAVIEGTNPSVQEASQRLEVTLPANSVDSAKQVFEAGYQNTCQLDGDFDVQVDYDLLDFPQYNGVRVGLTVGDRVYQSATLHTVERMSLSLQEGGLAASDMVAMHNVGSVDATGDTGGSLRLARVGSTLSGYRYVNNAWQFIGSESLSTNALPVTISAWSHNARFDNKNVKVAFDNFKITKGTLVGDSCKASQSYSIEWHYPSLGTLLSGRGTNPVSVVAGESVEVTGFMDNAKLDVDIIGNKVKLFNFRSYTDYPNLAQMTIGSFNGLVLRYPLSASIGHVTLSVDVNGDGDFSDIDDVAPTSSKVTVTGDYVAANLSGVSYTPSTVMYIEFQAPLAWTPNPTNGHQYAAVDCGTWTQCEAQAVALGAHLVTVNDAAENAWLVSTFDPSKNYWIGLTDKDQEGVWKWTSGEAFEYSNWMANQPNNSNGVSAENYAHMNYHAVDASNPLNNSTGLWNDAANNANFAPYQVLGLFEKSSGITATISTSSTAPVAGTAVTFSLVDTVVDGIKSVVWKVGDSVVKVLASIADAFEYIFDKSGAYTITASLKDAGDQVVLAPSLSVQVASQPPVASLVGSSMTSTVGQSVNFVLSGSKANEGKLCSYLFDNGQGLDAGGSIDCTDTSKTLPLNTINMQYTAIGTYTATLTVTDSQGKSATTTWLVNVGEATQIADTGKLNDTGITQCSNDTTIFSDCSATSLGGWFGLNQDGEVGRDALAAKGQLSKVGGGDAGFDFTKISATGQMLPANATEWSCVLDNHTGLMWEVKTDDGGLRDKDNTYAWYNSDATTNGGFEGYINNGNNTQAFAQTVNAQGLCGHNDWRLPSKQELHSIVNYGKYDPAIDANYFSYTQYNWSSSTVLDLDDNVNAHIVYFYDGQDHHNVKSDNNHVLLVRSSQ